jgi:lipopolysaccharide/colanic/teichoic acid biosynthesis glycosyltransferase
MGEGRVLPRVPVGLIAPRLVHLVNLVALSVAVIVRALAPLMAVQAMLVRWHQGPGVMFKQGRVGLDGRTFTVRKFRS